MSIPTFQCEKCGSVEEHRRLGDPAAGELWRCPKCGWKTIRDESKAWAKVRPEYEGAEAATTYEQDMKDERFRKVVDFMCLVTDYHFFGWTAAEARRAIAILVRSWASPDDQIADELRIAGFDLSGKMSSPEAIVARIRKGGSDKYRQVFGERRKWWHLWKR